MNKIGEKLRAFFKEKGFTQEYIAEQLGVSQAYVGALFSDKKQFGKKQAYKWNELFGLSPNWLLTGEGEMLSNRSENSNSSSPTEMISIPRDILDQITRLTETVLSQQKTMEAQQKTIESQQLTIDSITAEHKKNACPNGEHCNLCRCRKVKFGEYEYLIPKY
ncbi:helix-turn-helix domain-containing protein [Bacteroides fragilis]